MLLGPELNLPEADKKEPVCARVRVDISEPRVKESKIDIGSPS